MESMENIEIMSKMEAIEYNSILKVISGLIVGLGLGLLWRHFDTLKN